MHLTEPESPDDDGALLVSTRVDFWASISEHAGKPWREALTEATPRSPWEKTFLAKMSALSQQGRTPSVKEQDILEGIVLQRREERKVSTQGRHGDISDLQEKAQRFWGPKPIPQAGSADTYLDDAGRERRREALRRLS